MTVLDLSTCEQEPIHLPGSIQPHGVLLALHDANLGVLAASANLEATAGVPAPLAIGGPLAALLQAASLERVRALVAQPSPAGGNPFPLSFAADGGGDPWQAMLHRHNGVTILEAESPIDTSYAEAPFATVSTAIERMQATADTAALCAVAVQAVRHLTGFDRVKLYRFHPDWSGEVLAEDRADHMPAFLGLMFPASDIPAQARELYRVNPDRLIPDCGYTPVPLLGSSALDLSFAQLRSVSPIHLQYLANMGVGASMSISVLRGGQLWGLIACHHAKPHRVGPRRRQACRLLAQVLAWQLASGDEVAIARHSVSVRALQTRVLLDSAAGSDHRTVLQRHAADLMTLTGARGFALVTPEGVTLAGTTPDQAAVRELATWIAARDDGKTFETDRLGELHRSAVEYAAVASGALAVPLSRPPTQMMLWFRPEAARTVTWGGDPNKAVEPVADGLGRLTPRQSFAAWRQEVTGRSWPWQPHELVAAGELRDLVLNVLVRRAEALERINDRLARSNEELEAFTYIASHDIREPLRQIETFAGMLESGLGAAAPGEAPKLARWLEGIEASSRRLRNLIDDLTEYSRLGRYNKPMLVTSLAAVLQAARSDLAQAIGESGAEIEVDGLLPDVMADETQLRQVLQNLLENAIKYRHPARPPHVTVAAGPLGAPEGMVRVTVADNGIGFEQRHATRIFEPFQRLHGPDSYAGTGIGLAICRKLISRHGGSIGAKGIPDQGSTFWFTLPAAEA